MVNVVATRDDYFAAAMKLLATEGAGRLKIAPLCKAVKVTTGSFYGYFGSFDGFVREFLAYWEQTQTERIVELSNHPLDPADRVHVMKLLAAQLPHAAEAAIRSWAHTNTDVAAVLRRVDQRREDALAGVIQPVVGSPERARTLAIVGMTLLVGIQQWRAPVTTTDFDRLFGEYEALILMHHVNGQAS